MSKFDHCGDLYDLNSTNTKLYDEHQKWYDEYKAASVGDLIDRQADIIDRYERAMDHSTTEINELKDEKVTNEKIIVDYVGAIKKLQEELIQYKKGQPVEITQVEVFDSQQATIEAQEQHIKSLQTIIDTFRGENTITATYENNLKLPKTL